MATQDITTTTVSEDEAFENARLESDAAYALKQIGELIRLANEGNSGFESLSHRHWAAIGIAVEQLADRLYSGSISHTLETIFDKDEA